MAQPRFRRFAAGCAGVATCCAAGAAAAAETAPAALVREFPAAQVFTLLFLMLGPFKTIAPFAQITGGADARLTRGTALWATLYAGSALLIAAFLGELLLAKYGIPVPVLSLSAGIILFLVALRHILEQFDAAAPALADAPVPPTAQARRLGLQVAFPAIVTPHGIAALVVFLALSQGAESRLKVGAIVVVIMGLNLLVMLVTRRLLPVLALLLPIIGAVLGIVQVALGLQIVHNSIRAMGLL
jgi:multiple antibiotic resistance protein